MITRNEFLGQGKSRFADEVDRGLRNGQTQFTFPCRSMTEADKVLLESTLRNAGWSVRTVRKVTYSDSDYTSRGAAVEAYVMEVF